MTSKKYDNLHLLRGYSHPGLSHVAQQGAVALDVQSTQPCITATSCNNFLGVSFNDVVTAANWSKWVVRFSLCSRIIGTSTPQHKIANAAGSSSDHQPNTTMRTVTVSIFVAFFLAIPSMNHAFQIKSSRSRLRLFAMLVGTTTNPTSTQPSKAATSSETSDWKKISKDVFKDDKRPIILFDGQCNLCNGGVNFAIDHDPKGMDDKFFVFLLRHTRSMFIHLFLFRCCFPLQERFDSSHCKVRWDNHFSVDQVAKQMTFPASFCAWPTAAHIPSRMRFSILPGG